MKNYLIQRKKRYFWPGGELTGSNPNGIAKGMDYVSKGIETAQFVADTLEQGKNNYDKGKADTQEGMFNENRKQAENVGQAYTAGHTQLNYMSRNGASASAKDLKTTKGWKNVLGATGKGAALGNSIGTMIMPGIGTAIGTAAGAVFGAAISGIGEWIGARRRKKEAEKLARLKRESDHSINYYNSRQAEQLASANDNAAKAIADQNRQSVLNLVAYGGRLNRRNYLLNKSKLC